MSDESQRNDSDEFDKLVEGLQRVERARNRRTLLITMGFIVLGCVSLAAAYIYREALFVPDLGIEKGEAEVLAETNDPQCRKFIADVTDIGKRFSTDQSALEGSLLGDDLAKAQSAIKTVASYREELIDARVLSGRGELRFDDSSEELAMWFDHIDNELRVLDSVGQNAVDRLKPAEPAPTEPQVVELKGKGKKVKTRKPKERVDGALLASDDAFQNFRVWHTSSLHPCGKADETETPWTPESELSMKVATPSK